MKCCSNDNCRSENPKFDSYSHICRECAKALPIYPKNSFSLLAACEALMMHHRGSSDLLTEKEFFKLKNSIRRILDDWRNTYRVDEALYDGYVKAMCTYVVHHVRYSL
jgi:hypothetical protein